jgi:hypothetical protein
MSRGRRPVLAVAFPIAVPIAEAYNLPGEERDAGDDEGQDGDAGDDRDG